MAISIEHEHFSLNKFFLFMVGLWPYHRSKLVEFHLFLILSILISFIMFQVRYMLEKLQHISDELKDDNEVAIFRNYGNNTKQYTARLMIYIMCNIVIFTIMLNYPQIFDVIIPVNTSEPLFMIHIDTTEYFVDQKKYSYLILLHMDAAIFIGLIVLTATGTLLVGYLKHVCGMFKIASYRINQAMACPLFQNTHLSSKFIIYKIVHAVDIHRKGIELCDILKSNFMGSFFSLILVGVLCLSLNLYEGFQVIILKKSMGEFLKHFLCIMAVLIYMFLGNYIGQEITDHHNDIFISVYNLQWYTTPLYIQKIILFLLQKGTKNFYIVYGGLFVVSLESAAMLFSTSISYFTVLFSTQQG